MYTWQSVRQDHLILHLLLLLYFLPITTTTSTNPPRKTRCAHVNIQMQILVADMSIIAKLQHGCICIIRSSITFVINMVDQWFHDEAQAMQREHGLCEHGGHDGQWQGQVELVHVAARDLFRVYIYIHTYKKTRKKKKVISKGNNRNVHYSM